MVVGELIDLLADLPIDLEITIRLDNGETKSLCTVADCVREAIGPNEDAVVLTKGAEL